MTDADDRALQPEVPVAGMPTRSGSVARTLLLAALIATALMALAFQFGIGDTVINRPGELTLLLVDIAPALWFGAAAVLLTIFRWQTIDQRFRWVLLAAVASVVVSLIVRLTLFGQSWLAALLEPFTLGFLVVVASAVAFTRTRVRRLARGTDAGITITGIGLGFAVVGVGVAIGSLRVGLVGPPVPPGAVSRYVDFDATTGLLISATLVMVAALLWLTDRTRNR
ncbi:MAG: hypothetical protein KIT89_04135 [Microcella sp.]|uniref:hypothetical protein n=1 Tax=Microcella sp. TaxID=1913979 RepID=UPI0024CDA5CC|nr:hypothetical protein [Microcella sp.]UYN84387.1 MAG: hypothetical protein KIT89_04135 [Microcella sp.]